VETKEYSLEEIGELVAMGGILAATAKHLEQGKHLRLVHHKQTEPSYVWSIQTNFISLPAITPWWYEEGDRKKPAVFVADTSFNIETKVVTIKPAYPITGEVVLVGAIETNLENTDTERLEFLLSKAKHLKTVICVGLSDNINLVLNKYGKANEENDFVPSIEEARTTIDHMMAEAKEKHYTVWRGGEGGDWESVPESQLSDYEREQFNTDKGTT